MNYAFVFNRLEMLLEFAILLTADKNYLHLNLELISLESVADIELKIEFNFFEVKLESLLVQ